VKPLAPGRHLVQFTIDDADLERLQRRAMRKAT
jgi:hypothetical protein